MAAASDRCSAGNHEGYRPDSASAQSVGIHMAVAAAVTAALAAQSACMCLLGDTKSCTHAFNVSVHYLVSNSRKRRRLSRPEVGTGQQSGMMSSGHSAHAHHSARLTAAVTSLSSRQLRQPSTAHACLQGEAAPGAAARPTAGSTTAAGDPAMAAPGEVGREAAAAAVHPDACGSSAGREMGAGGGWQATFL
jgi:hypothetical protein